MVKKKILNSKELNKVIKKYKKSLKKEKIDFSAIYLFGSYAKEKQHDWSDIDLAVVSDSFGDDYTKESVLLNRIADKINFLIQAHPFNSKHLRDPYSTLAQEIRKYGKKSRD